MTAVSDPTPRPSVPENHLLISAIAPNSVPLLTVIGKRVLDAGCNLLEARVALLGQEVSVLLLASGGGSLHAELAARCGLSRGDAVACRLPLDRLHAFDGQSGIALDLRGATC